MYRAYQPTLPTANLFLQEKWDRSRYAEHRRKVVKAVPAVDCKGSQTPPHLLVNMKKIQMDRDQRALIEKQNYIHLTKLNAIQHSHGRLDNWNNSLRRSLNIVQRRQNLSGMTQENVKILERILKRQSEYGGWKSEWEKVERIRANISRYPQYSGHDWVGQQTVTFMDMRSHVNVPHLVEESKTEHMPSVSAPRLASIPQTAVHGRNKEPSLYTDTRKQVSPLYNEESTQAVYGGSSNCALGHGATYSYQNKGTCNNTELEITDHKLQTICKSRGKTAYGQSENDINCVNPKETSIIQGDSDGMEDLFQEISVEGKCHMPNKHNQETRQTKKKCGQATLSYRSLESEMIVIDKEKEPHMSYAGSDESFDNSSVESNASSCYSLNDSKVSSSPSTPRHSAISETQLSHSLNLKTRATSKSLTSDQGLETPETLLHKLDISNTLTHNRKRSSQNCSSEELRVHYPLLKPNRSPDSLVHAIIGNKDIHLQGDSMINFGPSSTSSRNTQRSPNLSNQKTLITDSRATSESSSVLYK